MYIGPSGEIRAQDAPAVPEVSSDEEEDTDTVWAGSPIAAARRWRKYNAARKAREDASPAPFETAALVTARMKAASRNAQQGISKTRTAENAEQLLVSKLAGKLAAMRLAANRLAGPCIVHALDFQVQEEVLSLLSLEAAAAAAQVCTVWHELLLDESLWRRLVFAADPVAAAAATAVPVLLAAGVALPGVEEADVPVVDAVEEVEEEAQAAVVAVTMGPSGGATAVGLGTGASDAAEGSDTTGCAASSSAEGAVLVQAANVVGASGGARAGARAHTRDSPQA